MTITEGFVSSGQVIPYGGGYYYVGEYRQYGTYGSCYKYSHGDYTASEVAAMNNYMTTNHPTWTKISNPTIQYNCHAYAWITQGPSSYWLLNPQLFANSSHFSYIGELCGANSNDRILIYDSYGSLKHSAIAYSSGTESNSISTISKCGSAGVYVVNLGDLLFEYGSTYKVYR